MKNKTIYKCSACGATSPAWAGQCTRCREWNTLSEETVSHRSAASRKTQSTPPRTISTLAEVETDSKSARTTGIPDLDVFLGSGLVPGSTLLVGGEPGIGKSTLLLQLAGSVAQQGRKVLYLSGEESLHQIKGRGERLGIPLEKVHALSTNNADEALTLLQEEKPDLVILDSVQTFATNIADGIPGSVSQVKAVSGLLIEEARKTDTTLVLVGHVTKDGQIAGPRLMEHMVDTVLYLEGDRRHVFRILRVLKNRFGASDELLVMQMKQDGLNVVPDPSTFFLGARDPGLPGTAVVMAVESRKPFAVEVQALVTQSFLSIPRRTALGFDTNRLNLLLAVLEKHLHVNLGQVDIYTKIGGGLKLNDPGLDLGLVAAVLSSLYDRPLPDNAVFWGEVDLNGQIRPAAGHEIRFRQASRLGYGPILHSGSGVKGVKRIHDFQAALFGS